MSLVPTILIVEDLFTGDISEKIDSEGKCLESHHPGSLSMKFHPEYDVGVDWDNWTILFQGFGYLKWDPV